MADVYKALAHPVRREILKLLRNGPKSAGELADHFDLAKPTLSGHFTILKEAGLVTVSRKGTTLTYRLNVSVVEETLAGFLDVLKMGTEKDQTQGDEK